MAARRPRLWLPVSGRAPGYPRSVPVALAGDPGRYPPLPVVGEEFVAASRRAQTRATRLRRTVAAALSVLPVASLAAAVVAIRAQRDASTQRDIAISRRLAAQSELFTTADPSLAALLAAAAWRISPTDEARASMRLLMGNPGRGILTGHTGG